MSTLLNLYNNTNLVVNDNMKVDEGGGFDFLPFLKNVFGESGSHARAAVSANSLPLGVAVEVDAIFELK